MARLIYSVVMSLDGYIADEDGNFGWVVPDEEVQMFFNDLEREVGTHLYGRRMYETMVYWERAHSLDDWHEVELDYARVWQAADKVVYSRTLETASSARTRIERHFDPDVVRKMKAAAERDLTVGGARLARQAFGASLVGDRPGGRKPSGRRSRPGGRGHSGAAVRRPSGARAPRRTPFRQRHGPPPLPRQVTKCRRPAR